MVSIVSPFVKVETIAEEPVVRAALRVLCSPEGDLSTTEVTEAQDRKLRPNVEPSLDLDVELPKGPICVVSRVTAVAPVSGRFDGIRLDRACTLIETEDVSVHTSVSTEAVTEMPLPGPAGDFSKSVLSEFQIPVPTGVVLPIRPRAESPTPPATGASAEPTIVRVTAPEAGKLDATVELIVMEP